jgi:hypoxanthine phosphoribosyltransferase
LNAEKDSASPHLEPLISESEIADAVSRLAGEIERDYEGKSLVMVGVLKGSFVFLADLMRRLSVDVTNVEFVRASSYGAARESSGEVALSSGLSPEAMAGQHVLLAEDILDTGLTTLAVVEHLRELRAASVRVCALLDKPERRRAAIAADYVGFTIGNRFVVGYGLDANQRYRNLPAIYILR